MSTPIGKKWTNIDQAQTTAFGLVLSGPSLAIGAQAVGVDSFKENIGIVEGSGGATTPTGFIMQGATEAVSETVVSIQVV